MTFAPSNTGTFLYLALGVAIAGACAWWLPIWWAVIVFVVLLLVGWRQGRRVPPPLRSVSGGQWEQYVKGQWRPVTLHIDRLAPLLCEIRLDRKRYALWYDTLPPATFRRLRLALIEHQSHHDNSRSDAKP